MRVIGSGGSRARRRGQGAGEEFWKRRRLAWAVAIVALVALNVVLYLVVPRSMGPGDAAEPALEQPAAEPPAPEGNEDRRLGADEQGDTGKLGDLTVSGWANLEGVLSFVGGLEGAVEGALDALGVDPEATALSCPREAEVDQTSATVWLVAKAEGEPVLECSYDGVEGSWSCSVATGTVAGVNDR